MRPLTAFERRLLAVLLLIAGVVAIVAALAVPYNRMSHRYVEAIDDHLDQIARYRRIVATEPEVRKALADVASKDARKFFLKSGAPALAAADMQQVVQTLAQANGLQLETMQIAPPKNEDDYRKITVNLRLRGKLAGVQNMLYSLETTEPYLFVDNLGIQSTVRQNYRPVPATEPDVSIQFDLSGYAQVIKTDVAHRH